MEKRRRDDKELRVEILGGMGPESWFDERSRWSRFCKSEIDGEIPPPNDAPERLSPTT